VGTSIFAGLHLPRPDRRGPEQIAADLDDEFAFHLDEIERELLETGLDPAEARAAARRRFGDVTRIRKQCLRVALGERIMLQRVNLVLMVTVLLAVAVLSVQIFLLTGQLRREAPVETVAAVLVDGDIDRPGYYTLYNDDGNVLLLHEVLRQAGGIRADQRAVHLSVGPDGSQRSSTWSAASQLGDNPKKIVVRPGDSVRVMSFTEPIVVSPRNRRGISDERLKELLGRWRLDGDVFAGEVVSLDIVSADDIMNMTRSPTGTLRLPAFETEIRLIFRDGHTNSPSNSPSNSLELLDRLGRKEFGRWKLDEGRLTINVARAAPDVGELQVPLVFVRTDA